ncbi:MAG: hypothetical protein Tsb002_11380 [Wenzhouxiangellaceae bacterium]
MAQSSAALVAARQSTPGSKALDGDFTQVLLPASVRKTLDAITHRLRNRGWAIAPDSAQQLAAMVLDLQPRQILEFGCGVSTIIMAACARELSDSNKRCRILSLEQGQGYARRTRQRLDDLELASFSTIIHTPLSAQRCFGQTIHSYAIDSPKLRQQLHSAVDFCFIDGPASAPLFGRPGSRLAALPLALSVAAQELHFVLDDTQRSKEQRILKHWQSLTGVSIEHHYPQGRGMTLGRWCSHEPQTAEDHQ